ncbi:unnamed protein product [Paramecium sonneborni]|uniref:EF-hand domain-containing protein n=1 Tax=Paramecium sonneborni TaxID=65129 RepID=A0A8S1NBE8_9CILI|nr:unnamed protein product [Paramecium sonneborni]
MNYRIEKADLYIRQHRIIELFEDLTTAISYEQPADIKKFLIEQLQLKQKFGFKTGLFKREEIDNIFTLFDLKQDGWISRKQAIDAFKVMAASQYQLKDESIFPEKVTKKQFADIVGEHLGIK